VLRTENRPGNREKYQCEQVARAPSRPAGWLTAASLANEHRVSRWNLLPSDCVSSEGQGVCQPPRLECRPRTRRTTTTPREPKDKRVLAAWSLTSQRMPDQGPKPLNRAGHSRHAVFDELFLGLVSEFHKSVCLCGYDFIRIWHGLL